MPKHRLPNLLTYFLYRITIATGEGFTNVTNTLNHEARGFQSFTNYRTQIGCSVALSEAKVHWRQFLESLPGRGILGAAPIASDDHSGRRAARDAVLSGVTWQRCQCQAIQNAMAHVPKMAMKAEVAAYLRRIFEADDSPEAQRRFQDVVVRYRKAEPQFTEWIEANLPEALTAPRVPASHRRPLHSINGLERPNKELKQSTCVATVLPEQGLIPQPRLRSPKRDQR